MTDLSSDHIRTPEWELSGWQFLCRVNPKRYEVITATFLDGMFIHHRCFDKQEKSYLPREIIRTPSDFRRCEEWKIPKFI